MERRGAGCTLIDTYPYVRARWSRAEIPRYVSTLGLSVVLEANPDDPVAPTFASSSSASTVHPMGMPRRSFRRWSRGRGRATLARRTAKRDNVIVGAARG
jgi:hypothetical protein